MGREAIDRQGLRRQSEPEPAEDERPPAAAQAGLLELQRAHGNQAVTRMLVARHPVQHVPAHHRATKLELLGDGTAANPGMQLGTFESSTRAQADWFAEPTLTDADRDKVWPLLRRASQSFVLSGAGDVLIGDLLPLSAGDWRNLIAFGRACEPGNTTHVVDASVYPLAQRIAMGKTLLELEQVVQPDVLRLTTNEAQLKDIHTAGLVPQIAAYWAAFSPHMQEQPRNEGERGPEFQRMLDMLAGGGHGRFAALLGRVRNLHRFSAAMLTQLIANFADHTRARPADLILHTGHDESAFNESAFLFSDLVVNSPHNVLFLEGQASLAAITAEIPKLTAAYGQPDDKGVPRLAQTMIAGHGEARVTELAGTGNERVEDEQVVYDSESLDLDNNNKATVDLLDALESNMDPKTARLVFAGCLVGSNFIPAGTPAGGVVAQMAAQPSLGPFAESRGAANKLKPGFTQSARASVALGAATSLMDASGKFTIKYPFDPDAFATPLAYIATGHEPEGLLRAVVEVIATATPVVAEHQLRLRLAAPPTTDPWWDEMTLAAVRVALNGVAVGAGVDHGRILALSHMVGVPFLARWAGSYGREASTYVAEVNPQAALAALLYDELAKTPTWTAPPDDKALGGRLIGEQGWMMLPAAREAALLAFLDATPGYKPDQIAKHLDPGVIGPKAATLFPAGPPTAGQIRLALAWIDKQAGNVAVRAFLSAQVEEAADGPHLSAAVKAQLSSPAQEPSVLATLGRGTPHVDGKPAANADVLQTGTNRVLIEPRPYEATVIPDVANVRNLPGLNGRVESSRRKGAAVSVMGFVHDWAAIDDHGELAFIHRTLLTPP